MDISKEDFETLVRPSLSQHYTTVWVEKNMYGGDPAERHFQMALEIMLDMVIKMWWADLEDPEVRKILWRAMDWMDEHGYGLV